MKVYKVFRFNKQKKKKNIRQHVTNLGKKYRFCFRYDYFVKSFPKNHVDAIIFSGHEKKPSS